jgi:hypothetical protein
MGDPMSSLEPAATRKGFWREPGGPKPGDSQTLGIIGTSHPSGWHERRVIEGVPRSLSLV